MYEPLICVFSRDELASRLSEALPFADCGGFDRDLLISALCSDNSRFPSLLVNKIAQTYFDAASGSSPNTRVISRDLMLKLLSAMVPKGEALSAALRFAKVLCS